MMIRFNVGNFLSFKDIQEFSMIASKVRNKTNHLYIDENLKLIKFAAIFGANASGKSNFVKSIEFARNTILNGRSLEGYNNYYKLDDECINKPSYFEFEIVINGLYYSYGFEVILEQGEFTSEWLLELLPNGDKKIIFERNIEEGDFRSELNIKEENLKVKFDVYADDIKTNKNILFLNEMNRNKMELYRNESGLKIFNTVFEWFFKNLDINHPFSSLTDFSYFNNVDKKRILDIIKGFGTGITDFKIVELSMEDVKDKIPEKIINDVQNRINDIILRDGEQFKGNVTLVGPDAFYIINIENNKEINVTTIEFEHEGKGKNFNVSEESDGTRRIMELIRILLSDDNSIFIIDEIDRSLHPQLTYKFVETFLKVAEKKNIQLIITTHESRLLDFDLLRQDEIWLVNKNNEGESSLYSLDEYNVRFDRKVDKAYLEGRYGGVPIFSTIFPIKED